MQVVRNLKWELTSLRQKPSCVIARTQLIMCCKTINNDFRNLSKLKTINYKTTVQDSLSFYICGIPYPHRILLSRCIPRHCRQDKSSPAADTEPKPILCNGIP